MEYQRRLASGRLAEVLGEPGLLTDRFLRTVGLHRAAASAWANLGPGERKPILAYVAGVNAFLANQPNGHLPAEFGILGVEPEPWRPEDVLAAVKLSSWGTSSNWDYELLRARLAAKLGPAKAAQLMPAYTPDGPTILPTRSAAAGAPQPAREKHGLATRSDISAAVADGLLALNRAIEERTGIGTDGRGSNSWVLGPSRTTTGKPLLANDPHLPAQTPSFWYLAHLTAGDHDVIGASQPGAPGIVIGRNRHIAWGMTTNNADEQDLYVERVNENNEVEYRGGYEPLTVVAETIKVKNGPDIKLAVRISRHGPLISDVVNPAGQALALRWTGLEPEDHTLRAFLGVNRARNWDQFNDALRHFHFSVHNFVYADTAGNIGYLAPGRVPVRAGGDGTLPVPGWAGDQEWTGYVPFAQLPRTFNPPQGYIVTANNQVAPSDFPYLIGTNFASPYRAARVLEMIGTKRTYTPGDMATMQADVLAVHARNLLPILLETQPTNARGERALELLWVWDARMTKDSPQAAIFAAWYNQIAPRLFADELGDALWADYAGKIHMIAMALEAALHGNSIWCDDVRTPAVETRQNTLAAALADGLADMARAQGTDDLAAWRWGTVHQARFPHNPFDRDPLLAPIFSRSIPNDGDKFTVNVGLAYTWASYEQQHVAGYRQIVDFADLARSRFITAPGQSGDPSHPHYDDLLPLWQRVEYLPMRHRSKADDAAAAELLILQP